jgi:hypothetical protein
MIWVYYGGVGYKRELDHLDPEQKIHKVILSRANKTSELTKKKMQRPKTTTPNPKSENSSYFTAVKKQYPNAYQRWE